MTDARVLLALATLCVYGVVFASLGIKSALAPFTAVCTAIIWFTFFGMFGLLPLGGWLFYLGAVGGIGFLICRHGLQKKAFPKIGFGFGFFVLGSLLIIGLLWAKNPLFLYWDEFSFWGTAGKVVKLADELYTTAEVGWRGVSTQKPGLIVLAYFFQFFGDGFVEWQTYAAYDVFMLAGLAAVLVAFEKRKHWDMALPMAFVLFMVPFVFRHGIPPTMISNVYMDSTAELPLATTFGAILVCYYGAEKKLKNLVPVCLGLATLVLLKDAALVFGLVAATLIFTDALFIGGEQPSTLKKRVLPALGRYGITLGSVGAAFIVWEVYTSRLLNFSRMGNVGGSSGAGMLQMPGLFVMDLLSPNKTEVFTTVTSNMVSYFFARSTMFGSGFTVMLGIWVILGLAAYLSGPKSPMRRQSILFGVFSTLGFFAYYFFIMLSYLYILSEGEALLLASYDRYIYPFYMGWFMAALFFLGKSAAAREKIKNSFLKLVIWGLSVIVLLRSGQMLHLGYTVFGVNPQAYNETREFKRQAAWVQSHLTQDDKLFMVLSEDGGLGIFKYVHELLPVQVDYSFGGGAELREKRQDDTGATIIVEISREELEKHLLESGSTMLYIDSINERFKELYRPLFEDDLAGWESGSTAFYKIVPTANGGVRLFPVAMNPEKP